MHAVSDDERAEIDRRVAAAPPAVADAFGGEVRKVREAMAVVSAATAAEPPAHLRAALLQAVEPDKSRNFRWRAATLAAAAAIVVGLTAFGMAIVLRHSAAPTMAEQILAAPDVHTVSGRLGDGTATVVFSRDRDAGCAGD